MATYVSPSQAARMIDGFMLGAVMQQDPFLEEFGSLPEEPPDEDPCWDAPDSTEPDEASLEQGMLFDLPPETDPKKTVPKPVQKVSPIPAQKPSDLLGTLPAPSRLNPLPYSEHLKIHCGNSAAAMYWYKAERPQEFPMRGSVG